jgi:hypothetical protein
MVPSSCDCFDLLDWFHIIICLLILVLVFFSVCLIELDNCFVCMFCMFVGFVGFAVFAVFVDYDDFFYFIAIALVWFGLVCFGLLWFALLIRDIISLLNCLC